MHGEYKVPGGKLVVMDLDVESDRLCNVQLSGDFFLEPDTALVQINAALDGMSVDSTRHEFTAAVDAVLAPDALMFGFSAEAVTEAIRRALAGGVK